MSEIRFLSLWQPWATLIALHLKRYETRSWDTPYRGKLAIHAAKRPVNRNELAAISYNSVGHLTWEQLAAIDYPLGCIVEIADLANCQQMASHDFTANRLVRIHAQTPLEKAVGDWAVGRYAWEMKNVIALPQPLPMKGAQGLRSIKDAEVLAGIEQQLRGVAA